MIKTGAVIVPLMLCVALGGCIFVGRTPNSGSNKSAALAERIKALEARVDALDQQPTTPPK